MVTSSDPFRTILGHSFFSPRSFRATALVHYWTEPPRLGLVSERPDESLAERVINMDESSTLTATRDLSFDASLWVLLFGAPIGGLLALLLQITLERMPLRMAARRFGLLGLIGGNIILAALLPAVVTILLARLLSVDAPITIRVRDLWGAVAMGFVVQWLGVRLLNRLIPDVAETNVGGVPVGKDRFEHETTRKTLETNGSRESGRARSEALSGPPG